MPPLLKSRSDAIGWTLKLFSENHCYSQLVCFRDSSTICITPSLVLAPPMNPPETPRSAPVNVSLSGGGTCVNKGGPLDAGNRFKVGISDPPPLGRKRQAVFEALCPKELFVANISQVLFRLT